MMNLLFLATGAAMAVAKTTVKLGAGSDLFPLAYEDMQGNLVGIVKDIADAMNETCSDDLHIEVVKTSWSDCWTSGGFGTKINSGDLDGCIAYTHTKGERNKKAKFTGAILQDVAAVGILTMLADGVPRVNGFSDLQDKVVININGESPPPESLSLLDNKCTGQSFASNTTILSVEGNDRSMQALRNGHGDVIYTEAGLAQRLQCNYSNQATSTWNCSLWEGFGKQYAYVQSGMTDYAINGTTVMMGKNGTVVAMVNACLDKFLPSEEYYNICVNWNMTSSCYQNSFFPKRTTHPIPKYDRSTVEQTGNCSCGYCPCHVRPQAETSYAVGAIPGLLTCVILSIAVALSLSPVAPAA